MVTDRLQSVTIYTALITIKVPSISRNLVGCESYD